jgi:hypothetical protein
MFTRCSPSWHSQGESFTTALRHGSAGQSLTTVLRQGIARAGVSRKLLRHGYARAREINKRDKITSTYNYSVTATPGRESLTNVTRSLQIKRKKKRKEKIGNKDDATSTSKTFKTN